MADEPKTTTGPVRGARRFRTTAAVTAAFAAGITIGPMVAAWAQEGSRAETYRLLNLFGDVFERVRAEYVEPVNDRDVIDAYVAGAAASARGLGWLLRRTQTGSIRVYLTVVVVGAAAVAVAAGALA